MGDLNQDGYDDILVGIPLHISSSTNSGGAFAILHLGENAESILDVFVFETCSDQDGSTSRNTCILAAFW